MAGNPLVVLPGLQNDVTRLITAIPPLKVLISLNTQVTDNKSVLDKEITPQAIAIDRYYW
jgi:hypothetical protein